MAPPLRKTTLDGKLYTRRPEIEAALEALAGMSRSDMAERSKISDLNHADYLPPELLIHLVRNSRGDNDDSHFERIYRSLRLRVLARLPSLQGTPGPDNKTYVPKTNIKITEQVMDRFQEILIRDRAGYDDRMDYFEVNFDAAVASLKSTARRKAWKEENASQPLSLDEETNDLSPEIEAAAAAQNPLTDSKIDDPYYRSRLDAAIDGLPPNQRMIIELLRQGIPIESKEPNVPSIVDLVGAVEKTVRNRRDRAFEAIRKALKEEEP
jgi:hypothetical protein